MRVLPLFTLIVATAAVSIALIAVAIGDEDHRSFDAVVAEGRRNADFENDHGKRGDSAGDVIGAVSRLQRNGQDSGSALSLCTITEDEVAPTFACTTTLDFAEGSIVAEGIFDIARKSESQEFAILGGTGDYGGGRGTITVEPYRNDKYILSVDAIVED